jgi:hypothetical protein
MRRFVGLILVAAAVACGSSGSGGSSTAGPRMIDGVQILDGFNPGPAPDPGKGFQVIMPIVDDIAQGGSYEYCTDTSIILEQDAWISATESWQSETGHHVVMYYTLNHTTPGTHICTNSEMADFRYGVADGGDSSSSSTYISFPGDLAAHLPAGAQIVVNHHYLNASAGAIPHAQSALNIYYADPSKPHTATDVMVVSDSTLVVPTGASTYSIDCTIDQEYVGWMEIPHMHNLGQHITITQTPAATGIPVQLFDLPWESSFSFDPTIATKQPLTSPMKFEPGDKIHVECDYLNTTGSQATFGAEMCMFVAFTIDTKNLGGRICDRGVWGGL